jgi:hypothetical protein
MRLGTRRVPKIEALVAKHLLRPILLWDGRKMGYGVSFRFMELQDAWNYRTRTCLMHLSLALRWNFRHHAFLIGRQWRIDRRDGPPGVTLCNQSR